MDKVPNIPSIAPMNPPHLFVCRLLISCVFVALLSQCSPGYRKLTELEAGERQQLDAVLTERRQCYREEVFRLDDGVTNIDYIKDLVSWKCRVYESQIQNMLYQDFNVDIGSAWRYTDNLTQQVPNEIREALIQKRRAEQEHMQQDQLLLRKSPIPIR